MTAEKQHGLGRVPHPRYLLFLVVLLVTVWPLAAVLPTSEAIAAAFDFAVLAFVLSCISLWIRGGPEAIRRQAQRDDVGQVPLLLLSGLISVVILVTVAQLKIEAARSGLAGIVLLVATLIASWTFANLICALHYARLYYSPHEKGDCGGLLLPGGKAPEFADFVNFAFVIGMTCQTADIAITGQEIRRVSTFHGLFAFAFNLGILALAVNMLASLG